MHAQTHVFRDVLAWVLIIECLIQALQGQNNTSTYSSLLGSNPSLLLQLQQKEQWEDDGAQSRLLATLAQVLPQLSGMWGVGCGGISRFGVCAWMYECKLMDQP